MFGRMIGLGVLGFVVATIPAIAATEFPVVTSAALGTSRNLPWSEPVQVDDPFEGNFVAVFDRNYFYDRFLNTTARIEVQSLWSPQSVRVLLITHDRDCITQPIHYGVSPSFNCPELTASRNVSELFIKVDEQVFQIPGQNSTFPISTELAQALQDAPESNVSIRLITEGGATIDSEIGQGTVAAWKTVYARTDN
jgi:hypothetical protein